MTGSSIQGFRWAMPQVVAYVQAVEAAYNVSLKFWLTLDGSGPAGCVASVWVTGAGEAIDLVAPSKLTRAVEVKDGETFALGEATYYAALYVERLLAAVREPIGPRPSL